jgi:hypothetical protein
MSALFPAPAPALGVRWIDLPTHLDSIHPSCCLSYKQSAYLSPLCFHGLTNCFSRKPFVLITICVAPGCAPSCLLAMLGVWGARGANPVFLYSCGLFCALWALLCMRGLYFQRLTNSRKTPGVGYLRSMPLLPLWQTLSLLLGSRSNA